jgi:HlyD family secretion protein
MLRRAGVKVVAAVLLTAAAVGILIYLSAHPRAGSTDWVEGSGVVEATEVDVSPLVEGQIARLLVGEGERVKSGQLVAALDPTRVAPQLTQARGAVAAAEAGLAGAKALSAGAEAALANAREAYRKSTQLRGQYETAEAQHRAAVAGRDQAQATLDLVRAGTRPEEIKQAEAAVASAEAAYRNAERELQRLDGLLLEGAVSRQQVDLQRTSRDAAEASLAGARARLEQARTGARSEEKRAAEAALAQAAANVETAARALAAARELYGDRLVLKQQLDAAEAQYRAAQEAESAAAGQLESAAGILAAAEKRVADTKVRSPADGTVILKLREAGEVVAAGQPIVRMADLDRMWLRVYISETDLHRVKLGQRAEVSIDARPDKVYSGRLSEISQEAEFTPKNVQTREQRTKLVFGVKIEVENPDHELKPGMPADARIRVGAG